MPLLYSQNIDLIMIQKSTIQNEESQSTSMGNTFMYQSLDGSILIAGAHNENKGETIFSGIAQNNSFKELFCDGLGLNRKICDLLFRAVNNRTIERNYFRLYSDLLSGTISDQDFQQEITDNEPDYILENNIMPTIEDVRLAIQLSEHIKDVQSSEDISSLFSFNSIEIDKLLTK